MPSALEVILQHDVDNVGKSGDLVRVRPGFARNFLLPRQLAVPATVGAKNRIEHEKAVALARAEKLKKEYRDVADKLNGLKVTIAHRVGEEGRLFGAVTSKEIESAVKALGQTIERKRILLAEPIKQVGEYEIPVRFSSDVQATLKVSVVAK